MFPRKLTANDSEEERGRWKIIRADTMVDVPGLILSAYVETGICLLRQGDGSSKEYNFGSRGLRIVPAR